MQIPVSWLLRASAVLLLAWVVWLVLLWQPRRQIELHTANLLARASAGNWKAVAEMAAPGYRDSWGHGRGESLGRAEELGRHFFTLQIAPVGPMEIGLGAETAANSVPLGVFGSGTPMAYAVIDEVREAGGVFVFRWEKSGPWPWQWLLVEAGHAGLAARYPR